MENMFCFQCQEALKGVGCTNRGVCGKNSTVAKLQDLLIYTLKGISLLKTVAKENNIELGKKSDDFIRDSLFATITNANFDDQYFKDKIIEGLVIRDQLLKVVKAQIPNNKAFENDAVTFEISTNNLLEKAEDVGVKRTKNEDVRSLRELLTYGLKGIAAYLTHAEHLDFSNSAISSFITESLAKTLDDSLSANDLTSLVLDCGKMGVEVMALLDQANTKTYGHPELTEVNIGVNSNPGILISGHDLKDLEELLAQTAGTGVDVYTHGEMLPANYYPAFKKHNHFIGNYGNSWWLQDKEFAAFNGPILMTTNCITPPKDNYINRIYTTGVVGYPALKKVKVTAAGKKDFTPLIEQAKQCKPPTALEKGTIIGGFAHNQTLALQDKIIEAVKNGLIKKFVVMAGCDGRHKTRDYYTEFASKLPRDTVILTAGCAKYRYNKLNLTDIGGIPRVLDAGQCNDSYSLALIALKLKEAFNLDDINQLPIVYNIAWYEQKAVIVLLALLYLGVKNIHLGPTLPAFLSPNVINVLVENFNIQPISSVDEDLAKMIG